MDECPYSVYSLVDGELGFDDAYDTIEEAYAVFDSVVAGLRAMPDRWCEETVHLYYAPWGEMLAEVCVPRTVIL